MGCARETMNFWWKWKRYGLKEALKVIGKPYSFHDSIGVYFNKLIFCPIFGHRHLQIISDDGSYIYIYCFKCGKQVGNKVNKNMLY